MGRRLEASTSFIPASMANANFSLENSKSSAQRLCVVFQCLPNGPSVKRPSWGSWAARPGTGRVQQQLLQPQSSGRTGARYRLPQLLNPPWPWSARALFWETSRTAGFSEAETGGPIQQKMGLGADLGLNAKATTFQLSDFRKVTSAGRTSAQMNNIHCSPPNALFQKCPLCWACDLEVSI